MNENGVSKISRKEEYKKEQIEQERKRRELIKESEERSDKEYLARQKLIDEELKNEIEQGAANLISESVREAEGLSEEDFNSLTEEEREALLSFYDGRKTVATMVPGGSFVGGML